VKTGAAVVFVSSASERPQKQAEPTSIAEKAMQGKKVVMLISKD
jgi:hypothetical protein